VTAALTVQSLRAGYGKTEVLRGVDLTVPAGATVALLGANGAGKTTLLRTIAGLNGAWAGTVRVAGTDITSRPAHDRARRGVCLIPEGRGIFRGLTVRENLLVQARGVAPHQAVEQAAALFPILRERLGQSAGTLSGGQQQMLALARAFLTDATVILADEPSMGLAPVVVDEIFEAVRKLQAVGRSVLLVEQYAERAIASAHYVYILHKGSVVFVGDPVECSSSSVFARYMGAA
jgi:branched-chain amino acid transport system ATP-binding protein